MATSLTVLTVIIAGIILGGLYVLQRRRVKFSRQVFLALGLGIVFGLILQLSFGATSKIVTNAIDWLNIVGGGYVALLQMLITPLIFVSLVGAFIKLKLSTNIRRIGTTVLVTLLATTAIAALLGVFSVFLFHLQGADFVKATASKANLAILKEHQTQVTGLSIPQQIVSFLPSNIFADFAGTRATSTIAVVIFSAFVGVAFLGIRKDHPAEATVFAKGFEAIHQLVSRLVHLVLQLTPYGIFALMTKATATDSIALIANLGVFIVAAYVALIVVLLLHTLILLAHHINPVIYLIEKLGPH